MALLRPCFLHQISRKYTKENIIDKYWNVWVIFSYINNDKTLRSCEQKLIKLDKKELEGFVEKFVIKHSQRLNEESYALCALLHLIYVFCVSGQEEKKKLVQVNLNKVLHTRTERNIYNIFERYLSERLKAKSNLTEIDLLTGQIDPHHEFLLKLCYWDIFWAKNDNQGCKEFLIKNADFLLSNIEAFQCNFFKSEKTQLYISCKILLCLLNWNICEAQTPVTILNTGTSTSSSVALVSDTSTNYLYTAYTVSKMLYKLLSTLSEDDIFTTFNNYLEQLYAMKSKITEDDFCTGKIEPYNEFLLKLCYCEKLCNKSDDESYRELLRKNADLFVSQIEEIVHGNKTKIKLISCNILLCLLNWNICNQKATFILSEIQNTEMQPLCSFQSEAENTTKNTCTMYQIRCVLQNLLSTLTDNDISKVFNDYIDQMYAMNSDITPEGLCISETVSHHEFQLKLRFYEKLCNENDDETLKKFLRKNAEFLAVQIKKVVHGNKTKTKVISCKILLCLLNRNICNKKTSTLFMVQNTVTQDPPSVTLVADTPTKYSCIENTITTYSYTVNTITGILQSLLSVLSEDEIFTAFNDYLEQMYTMQSEITDDDLCTGKIEPYHEFLLKLCYCEKLCIENDYDRYKELLRKNADLFVPQIEDVVHANKKKIKLASCKVLLCLMNWNICNLNTTLFETKIQNSELQESCSFQSEAENTTKNTCTMYQIRCVLQNLLSTLTDNDISKVFNDYIDQMYAMNSDITPEGLCISETVSHHEFQLKLCYWKTICMKNNNEAYKKFIQLYPEILVSHIEEETVQQHETRTIILFCKTLLCILNWTVCHQKTSTFLNFQDCSLSSAVKKTTKYSYTAHKVKTLLRKQLSTLSEHDIFTTFNSYLEQMYTMKSEITEDDFCTGKIEPYHEFMLKICYCMEKWSETEDDFITRNSQFFLSMVEEVNKRNHLIMKFKMCQVLDIIMNGKIHITESMIFSITNTCKTDANFRMLTDPLSKKNLYEITIDTYIMIDCILLLKTKFDNFRKPTEKIPIQYQDHIKEMLIILLADMLIQFSTQQIYETFNLDFKTSCVPNPNIQLELAKTFLDISINPKISHDKKLIIGSKIQPILLPTADLTVSMEEKLDYKRIVNICINFVKTVSSINVPKYEGIFCSEKKALENEIEMIKRSQQIETLVLLMVLLLTLTLTSTGHHKSAKLKRYLSLKYEYAMASLNLLWCSGDIEVHPGPSLNKKPLAHNSTIERRWIQNISPKILILLPEHEQSKYKQTKAARNDWENREQFKALLKTCQEERVHVPKRYLAEINAWETKEYQLLHKQFVYRCEIETIIASLQDFLTCGGSTNDLTDINVSFDTELKTNEIAMILGKDQRPKDKSQLMVHITRHIAGISIKCAHGMDPDAKCDGLWDLPLKNWPTDIILFDPNNRGKYSKKYPGQKLVSDQELVDILVTLSQVNIPQKYKDIVHAFKAMRKRKTKQNKAELCSIFKRTTSLEKLDYALKNLSENGIFIEEVHDILTKWRKTGTVENGDDKTQSLENMNDAIKKKGRPHILINISTEFITLAVEPTSKSSSKVSYDFPFNDELVLLKTMATSASQTTVQKHSNDFRHKITAKKNLTLSPLSDANPADDQTDSITIPQEMMNILNSIITFDPSSQAIFESDIKLLCKTSTRDPAPSSLTHLSQTTSSAFQFSQLNQNIAFSGQPVPILCTPHQSTTNSDDLGHLHSSDTNVSQNVDLYKQVSPISDMGSSDSISSVISEAGNEERDQNHTLNECQDRLTDSDYSSDSSNNCVSKTSLKKRKCIEEDRNETKKRIKPSLKQDKELTETNNSMTAPTMDKSTISNKNMELLLDHFDIDLDSFDIDDQTFDVKLNNLDNEDKNPQICDKDGNLMNGETQMSNENTNLNAYNINVITVLEKFLQDMINCEGEKMSQMKSYV